jgi:YggT family protein
MMGFERSPSMPYLVLVADKLILLLIVLIFITSLMSWVQPDPRNPMVRLLHGIVDPVLHPIRTLLPTSMGMDFSPMVAILILYVLQNLLRHNL